MITTDMVDCYPSIDLPKLKFPLQSRLGFVFPSMDVQDFILKLINLLLDFKVVKIGAALFPKRRSLSIGECIATSAANCLRCFYFCDLDWSHTGLLRHYGYVDDCTFVFAGFFLQVQALLSDLDSRDPMFCLETTVSSLHVDYLDLHIEKLRLCPVWQI